MPRYECGMAMSIDGTVSNPGTTGLQQWCTCTYIDTFKTSHSKPHIQLRTAGDMYASLCAALLTVARMLTDQLESYYDT